ncbi:MAG: 3-oxoacyl-ACP reductase FabG [Deltaproteobacteria bacterium]|nr:3-oxoacyl-ACP reductase FabG [Deltaproteobacteria bacterium]MBW2658992.1 3-oxoacyl-ACP reductase FabG [Deltaproteobacteria bacterium]
MENFKGQTVVVTGATRGIGRAIADAFLKSEAYMIGVYAGNSKAAERFEEQNSIYRSRFELIQCDVASETEVQDLFADIEARFDTIDILVNNAGIRRDSIVALMTASDWQKVIDINLTGTFLMSKQAVLLMMKKKYGRIVNITSPVSHLGFPGQANYSASKAGLIGLTKTLAKETARKKITVNCVSPGFIATDFINDLSSQQVSSYKKLVPMRRFGTAEEVAESVLFLASARATYITGSVLEVTGGL